LVTDPQHNTKSIKRGGVLRDYARAEPRSLDGIQAQADFNLIAPEIYGNLLREKPGKLKPSEYVLEGDAAEAYEISPDGLLITMKLRPNVKWHNKPPVNGRNMDVQDVLFSMDRYAKLAALRSLVFNEANPDAPVLSVTAPDSRTITFKLTEPVSYMVNWFASFGSFTGGTMLYPKEADGGYDPRNDVIGHGPYMLTEHVPSVKFVLTRNPEYFDENFAYLGGIELPILSEYASRVAQFKAGNIHYLIAGTSGIVATDSLSVKRDEPRVDMYESDFVTTATVMTFGHLPVGNNKFQDERVRQALSMAWDRDLYIDVKYNVDNYRRDGLPVRVHWNSHLAARDPFIEAGWWLDPQSREFGPNSVYFQHNISEAKKLLSAAGYPDGFESTIHYPATPQYNLERDTEPVIGMLQEILRIKVNAIQDYTRDYIPNDRDAQGDYEGLGIHSVSGTTPSVVSPVSALVAEHWPRSGVTFHGYDVNGRGDKSGDPKLIEMLEKVRVERDVNSAKKQTQEIQRYLAKSMHAMVYPGGATGFDFAWPALRNFRVWRGTQSWFTYQLWLDETKAPHA
jgi:peptide/nickel transport system substrate-binding protein